MEGEKKPYPLLNWLKAQEEGRLVIAKENPLEHRQFSVTLRPTQIVRALKDCIKAGDLDGMKEEDLLTLYRVLVDYLLRRNPKLVEALYVHFKGRLERHYKARRDSIRR